MPPVRRPPHEQPARVHRPRLAHRLRAAVRRPRRLARHPQHPKEKPTTPADELTTAADLLYPLTDAAQADLDTDDFWKCYDPATAWHDGFLNGMGGKAQTPPSHRPPLPLPKKSQLRTRILTGVLTRPSGPDLRAARTGNLSERGP
ncbi:hypothetical protein [Streptomyces sp. NPDC046197]|uniref:hypothetical protein n=1 Tax=Streptomyces sp. NPDC046197 TaxID=3154337 RepID=UPI0033E3762B